jgi:two-component system sensor histidine kinase RegB
MGFFGRRFKIKNAVFSITDALSAEGENRVKLGWILRLRWICIAALILSAAIGFDLGFLDRPLVPLYLFVISGLALWNSASATLILRRKAKISSADLVIQAMMDIGASTLLLSITGGIYNPLSAFLLAEAVLASLLLRGAALAMVIVMICISLVYLQWDPDVSHLRLRGAVTRPVIFLSYALLAVILSTLTSVLSRSLARLQESLLSLRNRQERLDRLRLAGAMAAGFSHEFSTPLSTLKLRLERIQRALDKSDESGARHASMQADALAASAALGDCERILRDLTDNGLKARQLRLEVLPLAKTVAAWVKEYRERGGQGQEYGQIGFICQVGDSVCLEMPVQPLKRSFFDLLDNAFEASEGANGVDIELQQRQTDFGLEVQLSVLNSGSEFPSAVLEKWGEPFVTTKQHGTGLGLFNALTLVQAMGGNLTVTREPRLRTRVRLSFPARLTMEASNA